MKMVLFFAGPMVTYIALVVYVALMATTFGYEWLRGKENVLTEYIIIIQVYYFTCALLAVGPKRHSGKQK